MGTRLLWIDVILKKGGKVIRWESAKVDVSIFNS
ncbi:hypothetical protein PSM36_1185 [Proteiniphilum saccharofermentans]|jgi:hypothetical protein|uniref:Uncharacterized protein n=1 Tax=Proteiniphilum saccharofermentans TaxID=1642647 RepID=A0A1R3T1Q1_9BACT|nr:hypothetical protein PSM36_1185 [Proteiniphilum saccharofermentans]